MNTRVIFASTVPPFFTARERNQNGLPLSSEHLQVTSLSAKKIGFFTK
jgi:hypothetical protein